MQEGLFNTQRTGTITLTRKMVYETIDIDGWGIWKWLRKLTAWLKLQKFKKEFKSYMPMLQYKIKKSNSKGYHIIVKCMMCERYGEAPLCSKHYLRKKYDDKKRYAKDQKRPKYSQNVLFDKKKKWRII